MGDSKSGKNQKNTSVSKKTLEADTVYLFAIKLRDIAW